MTTFGERLREARQAKGWSANRLSRESGLAPQTIYNIESGKSAARRKTANRLRRALGGIPRKKKAKTFPGGAPTLGSRLRNYRLARGMTVREVSNVTGLGVSTISAIEHDNYQMGDRVRAKLARFIPWTDDPEATTPPTPPPENNEPPTTTEFYPQMTPEEMAQSMVETDKALEQPPPSEPNSGTEPIPQALLDVAQSAGWSVHQLLALHGIVTYTKQSVWPPRSRSGWLELAAIMFPPPED